MFTETPVQIIYTYGSWQDKCTVMQQSVPNFELFNGIASIQDLQSWPTDGNHRVLVLDDLMNVVENDIVLICLQNTVII